MTSRTPTDATTIEARRPRARAETVPFRDVSQSIDRMRRLTWDAVSDAEPRLPDSSPYPCRVAACAILQRAGVHDGDKVRSAGAIFDFVADRVSYVRDPDAHELLTDPRLLLAALELARENGLDPRTEEDCDGHAMLTAALGRSVRLPIVFVLAGHGGAWGHVYAAMELPEEGAPSPEWLAGDDRAPSGLLCLDTASPWAGWNRHANADRRLVVPAFPE